MTEIHGVCPEPFSGVRDAFAANFADAPEGLNELGARFTVLIESRMVIDLWGGHSNLSQSVDVDRRTLFPVFSTGKAVMALMIAYAVERGLLDYERPVAEVWPAFGQAGKAGITLGQLMSHQAGLSGFSSPIEPELWFDREAVLKRLAAQAPMWAPGTASGYHPVTIGYLAGEVFRRADGRSMGQALREDFAAPFALDLWLGLPACEHGRVAEIRKPSALPDLGTMDAIKRAAFFDRGSSPGRRGQAEWREAEIPSANIHATAEALARIMSILADGGRLEGRQVLSEATLKALMRERVFGPDKVLPFTLSWGAGLMRNRGPIVYGPGARTVGHSGWGGSCAMADPDRRLSAAYVMNRQSPYLIGDPRPMKLLEALYAAL